MKYLLSILCLFVLSCDSDSPTAPETIHGCLDSTACNYNPEANLDNNSCEYAQENYDCDGQCIAELDCNDECGGIALVDECGICGGSGVDSDDDGVCDDVDDCVGIFGEEGNCGDLDFLNDLWNSNGFECSGIDCENMQCSGGYINWENGRLVTLELGYGCASIITTLPESLGNLDALNRLEISYQEISSLPNSIGNLSSIERIYIENNPNLTNLPESIGNLSTLEELHLDNNQLQTLPESISNLSNLTFIGFVSNALSNLPESIGNLNNLTGMSAHGNLLTSLPESICNLPDNCSISVSGNYLCEEYHYDCIYSWDDNGTDAQDQSNCCEGVNNEGEVDPNWTTCP